MIISSPSVFHRRWAVTDGWGRRPNATCATSAAVTTARASGLPPSLSPALNLPSRHATLSGVSSPVSSFLVSEHLYIFFSSVPDHNDDTFSFSLPPTKIIPVTETYGYSPVVRIPRGATHIRLTDNSSNYLGTYQISLSKEKKNKMFPKNK